MQSKLWPSLVVAFASSWGLCGCKIPPKLEYKRELRQYKEIRLTKNFGILQKKIFISNVSADDTMLGREKS